jgi:hypothetical protein
MDRELTVGEVINGTIATVAENKQAALIFIAVLTVLGAALEWGLTQIGGGFFDQFADAGWLLAALGIGAGIGGIVFLIVAVVAQYLLWETMLRRRHQLAAGYDRRFLGFVGLSILTGLGIAVGYILLIVPGLIFTARWAMAPAYLIVERQGAIDSMGSSWEEIKGSTTPIVLAILAAAVVLVGASMAVGVGAGVAAAVGEGAQDSLVASLLGQFLSQVGTVLSTGLGVFLFGRLHGESEVLSEVFE